jgi:fucose 4-O-acetylase-like acetyltransferase
MGGILYGSGAGSGLFFNTILWFLPCLISAKVLLEILSRLSDKTRFLLPSLTAFAVTGYLFSIYFQKIKLPFHIETALTAVVFVGLGYLCYTYRDTLFPIFEKYRWQILILSLGILFISAVWNFRLTGLQNDMRLNRLNNIFLFYISSLSGIGATIAFSVLLSKNKVLEYFGRISLFLFVFHPLVFFYLNKLSVFLFGRDFFNQWKNIAFAPLYTIIALGIISLGTVLYITYIPAKLSGIKPKPSHNP